MKLRFTTLIVASVLLCLNVSWAQDPYKDIRVSGGSVHFIFNSLTKYTGGIELDSYTRLRVRFKYTGNTGWDLYVRALSTDIQYDGGAAHNLSLDVLELIPVIVPHVDNDPTAAIDLGFNGKLTEFDTLMASGDGGDPDFAIADIVITYKLGVPPPPENTMINKQEGYYFVDLRFTLIER